MAASGIPRWVWIFTPTVTLGFIGFLFYLSTVPAGNDIDKIIPSLSSGKPTLSTPKFPESRSVQTEESNGVGEYEFYQLLENKKVDVPEVVEYKSTPKGQNKDGKKIIYRLQAGSFNTQQDADRMKASLILNGMDTQVKSADINGKTWFRVYVGPFENRSKMNKAQDKLAEMRIQPMVLKEAIE